MNIALTERLNKIVPRLLSPDLLSSSGLGNEIGFHIFDYPPEFELEVREYIQIVLTQLARKQPGLRVAHVNLFALLVQHLEQRNKLEKVLKMQVEQGDAAVADALAAPLHERKIAPVLMKAAPPREHDLILLSGIGSAWPLVRSHTLLNNLHPLMHGTPLIVFYPGVYDGQGLKLFGRLADKNYYRAFRLVP